MTNNSQATIRHRLDCRDQPIAAKSAIKLRLITFVVLVACSVSAVAQTLQQDELIKQFVDPPSSARPRVWWHWMNGNITEDGIQKDIEWMSRVGVGGLQAFDAAIATPQIVSKRLTYMSEDWKQAFRFAAQLSDRYGLELATATAPGWSETGGPWVPAQDGMKKLVWSETLISGGERFKGQLPQPPMVTGPFQSLPQGPGIAALMGAAAHNGPVPTHYADVAVLAYRVYQSEIDETPRMTTSDGETVDALRLTKDSYDAAVEVKKGTAENPGALNVEYSKSQTIRSATLFVSGAATVLSPADVQPELQASTDGVTWHDVSVVPLTGIPGTVSFSPVTARYFRLRMLPVKNVPYALPEPVTGSAMAGMLAPPKSKPIIRIDYFRLSAVPRVHRFETKAGFNIDNDYYELNKKNPSDSESIAPNAVINLTGHIDDKGQLDWSPPPGQWKVIRLGASLLGTTNHPATAEATGLEVDKYDADAVARYLNTYLSMYASATGPELIGKRGLQALVSDSIEVGPSNWTRDFIAKFKALRGYDPVPWLPTLTGVLIGSRTQSDAFLYDFRRTLGDLLASAHYGQIAEIAHRNNLKVYGEGLEAGRAVLGDDMDMRKYADYPMAAFWTYQGQHVQRPVLLADMKGAASVAHVYGQNIVAAESLTSMLAPWAHAPADLKKFIDLEFAYGINRPVIHTSVHQPVDDKVPGLSLMIFGQYLNRHETWAELAKPWMDYIARSSFLLQQGKNVADVAYFYGEEAPLTALYQREAVTDAPTRYAYDFVSADAVLKELSVRKGELVSQSGAKYRVLYLGGNASRHMTLPVLRRLSELASAGAVIVGNAPESSPSLKDDRRQFEALKRKLWSDPDVTPVGKGKVYARTNVETVLKDLRLQPDVNVDSDSENAGILFVHRQLKDGDVYFLTNQRAQSERVDVQFRVTGKLPQLWHADTATVEPVSYRTQNASTIVSIDLAPNDSVFVVFRESLSEPMATVQSLKWKTISSITGEWDVAFQAERGAPDKIRLPRLQSLTDSADSGVKYFSGISTYTKKFEMPAEEKNFDRLWLDLGSVGDLAQVLVNGQNVATLWKWPYRADITSAVKPGENILEIRVANLWVNRLIGDAQPSSKKITFTTLPTYRADAPLRPAGLIGPVSLQIRSND